MWKPIKGYEDYLIDEDGDVFSHKSGKCIKPSKCNGYLRIGLVKDGMQRKYFVHRLVAEAFIDNPDGLPCINHKDENRENNSVNNLEWCSYKYNNNYGNRNKKLSEIKEGKASPWLEKSIIQFKDSSVIGEYKSIAEASRQTGITYSTISECANKKRKSVGGYQWGFKYE